MSEKNEAEKKMLEYNLTILREIINDRIGILPTISGLTATLLIIATFNEKLLKITLEIKILIATLLLLMPVSLFFHLLSLKMGEDSIIKSINKITGSDCEKIVKENRKRQGKIYLVCSEMVGISPYVIFVIFAIIILIIIFLIFK